MIQISNKSQCLGDNNISETQCCLFQNTCNCYIFLINYQLNNCGGGHWLVQMEWRPAGLTVCLPLLIFPSTIKSWSSLLAPAHPGSPRKSAVKRLWCGGGINLITWKLQITDSATANLHFCGGTQLKLINQRTAAGSINWLQSKHVQRANFRCNQQQ